MHRDFGLNLVRLVGSWFIDVQTLQPMIAGAQNAPAPAVVAAQQISAQAQAENTGQDFDRPLNMFQLRYEYKTAPGSGSEKDRLSIVTNDIVTLRGDHRIDLVPQRAVGLRTDLPFLAKDPISSGNPAGIYLYGVGDADFQAALLHEFSARWAAGFGARLTTPTGGDTLGSGKWQIMPGAAVRYALFEVSPGSYFEPFVRYEVSFAGDPYKKNISNLQFAPTLNLSLSDHWFFTFYPSDNIRLNYGDPVTGQTGRPFLPFDFMVGRKLTQKVVLSLEVSVPIIKDYLVYDFKTEVRLNVLF